MASAHVPGVLATTSLRLLPTASKCCGWSDYSLYIRSERSSPLRLAYFNNMVQAMYREEASQTLNPNLLTEREMFDLYWAYMGFPL